MLPGKRKGKPVIKNPSQKSKNDNQPQIND